MSGRESQREKQFMENVSSGSEEGLAIIDCGLKGRGVAATRTFVKGDYVCSYKGELTSQKVAFQR